MAYFDVAIQVLASIDSNTDFGEILIKHNMGLHSLAGNTETMLKNFNL